MKKWVKPELVLLNAVETKGGGKRPDKVDGTWITITIGGEEQDYQGVGPSGSTTSP